MHFQGEKRKRGEKNKKIKRGEKNKKGKRGEKNTKKRKDRVNAFYRNLVGAVFLNRFFSGEKACASTALLPKKFKTTMPLIYRPSSFKILRV